MMPQHTMGSTHARSGRLCCNQWSAGSDCNRVPASVRGADGSPRAEAGFPVPCAVCRVSCVVCRVSAVRPLSERLMRAAEGVAAAEYGATGGAQELELVSRCAGVAESARGGLLTEP